MSMVKKFSEKVELYFSQTLKIITYFAKVKADITAAAEAEGREPFSDERTQQQANLINLAETMAKADFSPVCGC